MSNTKRYLISSGITFLSVFLLTMGIQLQTMDITAVNTSAVYAMMAVAGRAGIKVLIEKFLTNRI